MKKTSIDRLDGTKGYKLTNTKEMSEEVVEESLEFVLTEEDFSEKGKEAGKLGGELNKINNDFDLVKKEWKDKIESKEHELESVLRTIRDGKEKRKVKCVKQKDFQNYTVNWIFDGEVMHSRPMELHERQMELKVVNAGAATSRETEKKAIAEQLVVGQANDVRDVMREETNRKTKRDHSTG